MTTELKLVTPSEDPRLNAIIYGPPKVGKTTGACSVPGRVLLVNADRPNASRFAHELHGDRLDEVHAEGLDTLIAVIEAARGDDYDAVVVDTVGELYRIVLESLSGRALRAKIQEYGDCSVHIERFCRALIELPVHTCLVLHENPIKDEETGVLERLPYTGTRNPVLAEKLMAAADVVAYAGVVRNPDTDEIRYMAQLFNGGGRRGGSRWPELGSTRELDLAEWVATIEAPAQKAAA